MGEKGGEREEENRLCKVKKVHEGKEKGGKRGRKNETEAGRGKKKRQEEKNIHEKDE